jgi:hypothetical protein
MKIILVLAAIVVAVVAIALIVGASLPKRHTVSRSATFKRDPTTVYAAVRDKYSKSAPGIYELVEDDPGHTFVTRIAAQNLGYSGSWTHEFEQVPDGTRLTITENGEVTNLFFRFMSRFVFGHTATIDSYLKSLHKNLSS